MTFNPDGGSEQKILAGAVSALAFVVHALSLRNGFVYDDVRVILDRTDVQSLANWKEILTSGWRPNSLYRPLTKLSLAAPVNDPLTCPNNSDSRRLSGNAPQLIENTGPSLRSESSWI